MRIKVRAAGVCLSDVHLIDGSIKSPYLQQDVVTLGHEVAGTVDALGPDVGGYVVGQRLLLEASEQRNGVLLTRGVDYDGGWAEYALASVNIAVQLLRLAGAAPIIAIDPPAGCRQRTLYFGADLALDPADPELADTIRRETGGCGLAVALDFAGVARVREQAVRCLGAAGRLALVGLTDKPLTINDGTTFSYFQ